MRSQWKLTELFEMKDKIYWTKPEEGRSSNQGSYLWGLYLRQWTLSIHFFVFFRTATTTSLSYLFPWGRFWVILPLIFLSLIHLSAKMLLRCQRIRLSYWPSMVLSYDVSPIAVKFSRSKKFGPVCFSIFDKFLKWPFLQKGHWEISIPDSLNMRSFTDSSDFSSGILLFPIMLRQLIMLLFLQRFAKNPKCRILINFLGSAWRKKRRINSFGVRLNELVLLHLRFL